jgi:hypothetical protein
MSPPAEPQAPQPTASRTAARRLLAREVGGESRLDAAAVDEVAAGGDRLVLRVTGGLARSFGAYGALALLSRALARVRVNNPVLATVTVTGVTAAGVPIAADHAIGTGLAASGIALGAAATVEGLTAWLAQLIDLLAELIGDDLTATILEQSATPRIESAALPRGADHDAPTTVDES